MRSEPTITALGAYQVLKSAEKEGLDIDLGKDLPSPEHPAPPFEQRLPFKNLLKLWSTCLEVAEPGFAMRAGMGVEDHSPVAFICTSRPTAREGLAYLIRYWPAVTNAYGWRLRDTKEGAWLELARAHAPSLCFSAQLEYDIADFVQGGLVASEGEVRPEFAVLDHASSLDAASETLGVEVRNSRGRTGLFYTHRTLDMVLRKARPSLEVVLKPALEKLMARFAQPSWADEVRALLPGLVEKGEPGCEVAAASLGVGRRTLERRLRAEGTSFQKLLDGVRSELAAQWLGHLSIKEVAFRLGYSEPRAFHRAFKRWTGQTPDVFRRQ